jgi:hypothetical protein
MGVLRHPLLASAVRPRFQRGDAVDRNAPGYFHPATAESLSTFAKLERLWALHNRRTQGCEPLTR